MRMSWDTEPFERGTVAADELIDAEAIEPVLAVASGKEQKRDLSGNE